jgi:hypothetical protein
LVVAGSFAGEFINRDLRDIAVGIEPHLKCMGYASELQRCVIACPHT